MDVAPTSGEGWHILFEFIQICTLRNLRRHDPGSSAEIRGPIPGKNLDISNHNMTWYLLDRPLPEFLSVSILLQDYLNLVGLLYSAIILI